MKGEIEGHLDAAEFYGHKQVAREHSLAQNMAALEMI
jgi:hypothetical protein